MQPGARRRYTLIPMEFLSTIKAMIPDWAKDIRLNLDATIARSSLKADDATGVALAAAYAARSNTLLQAFKSGVWGQKE